MITPKQEYQFNLYGCVCRCLIKLSEIQNKKITKKEFINRYANRYSHWSTKLGAADTFIAYELAKELNLCSRAKIYVNREKIKELFKQPQTRGILVFTEKSIDPNRSHEDIYHCRLLFDITSNQCTLFDPRQDGKDYKISVSDIDLQSLLPHFLVLS
jgi:hypothetical protein